MEKNLIPNELPQEPQNIDPDDEILGKPKKVDFNGVFDVLTLQKKIIDYISQIRNQGFTYENIGNILNMHKAQVYQIHKKKWWPKINERARADFIIKQLNEFLTKKDIL